MKCLAYDRRFVDHVGNAHSTPQDVVAQARKPPAIPRRCSSQRGSTRESSLATSREGDPAFDDLQTRESDADSDGGLSYASEGEDTARPARF